MRNFALPPWRSLRAAWLLLMAACFAPMFAMAQTQAESEYIYRFRAGDTLIQLSRRILLQPQRWPELQRRNNIVDPQRIPLDTPLRVPYSWLRLLPESARVENVAGDATSNGTLVTQGQRLPAGATIDTKADGSITLSFSDGSLITLQKASSLTLEALHRVEGDDGHSVRLKLNSGRMETKVQPRRDMGRFEISTPVAISAVRGTQFRASYDGNAGSGTTETTEGNVNVAGATAAVLVPAGFGTRVQTDGAPLSPVALLAAPDLAAIPATNNTGTLQVTFAAVNGASAYRIQLARDGEFRTVSVDTVSAQPAVALENLIDGAYWLRARAIDSNGIEGLDATREFNQVLLPPAPQLIDPVADARAVGATLEYNWNASPLATRYRLQVSTDIEFVSVLTDVEVNTLSHAQTGLPVGAIYWRVAAINAAGASGDWSEVRKHVQRPSPPTIDAATLDKKSLTLSWQTRDTHSYRIQLASDAKFERIVADQQTDATTLTLKKPESGKYFARVAAIDATGHQDAFGEPRSIDVPMPWWLKTLLVVVCALPIAL